MERCSCWRSFNGAGGMIQYCVGTKECEWCNCNGDKSKCDFYDYIRKEASKMNTAEMWLKAQEDGKTYRISGDDVCYQKDKGLFDKDNGCVWSLESWDGYDSEKGSFDTLMHETWEEFEGHFLTRAEVEAKYGIKIID